MSEPTALEEIKLDTAELSFDLAAELDSPLGLELFEGQALVSAETMIKSRTEFAYTVHMILQHQLYRFSYDSNGEPFIRAKDYLREFSHRCFVGVSTMWAYHTAIRMARQLGYCADDIADKGIYVFREVSKRVIKDRQTAAPLKLRQSNYQPDNLGDYLVEVIEDLAIRNGESPLRPPDFRAEIERRLEIGKPRIHCERMEGGWIRWIYERTKEDGMLEFLEGRVNISLTGNPPQAVLNWIDDCLKLGE